MNEFSILPWEYRGSGHSSAPHAVAALEIGGRKRDFLLKMREGVIYFSDPKRAPVWAVTRVFERQMADGELVESWRGEIERGNYGRQVIYRPNFPETSLNTALAIVHRSDYSGWVSELFRSKWHDIPAHRDGKSLDVWDGKFEAATRRAFYHTHKALLDGPLPASCRRSIEPRWMAGNKAELKRVATLITRLMVRRSAGTEPRTWVFGASNPTEIGGWKFPTFSRRHHADLQFSPAFKPLMKLLEKHSILVGLRWKPARSHWYKEAPMREQIEKWGEDWRGNFEFETPAIHLITAAFEFLSAHDQLEATLELRDWLRDKTSPRQCANWLAQTLD